VDKTIFDQYTGEILSTPVGLSDNLTDWLLGLHFKLLLEKNGIFLGAIVPCLLLFLDISGMVLYRKFWLYIFTLQLKAATRVFLVISIKWSILPLLIVKVDRIKASE